MNTYPESSRRSSSTSTRAARRKKKGIFGAMLGSLLVDGARSPVFATLVLLVAGAVFAGIIMMSYPGSDDVNVQAPIITADNSPYKEMSDNSGGMDVPHRDSTVFSVMDGESVNPASGIENLLATPQKSEELVDLASAEKVVEIAPSEPEVLVAPNAPTPKIVDVKPPSQKTLNVANVMSKTNAQTSEQKTVSVPEKTNVASEKPPAMFKAGSSPETIDFVRSVLEKKDAKTGAVNAKPEPVKSTALKPKSVKEVVAPKPAVKKISSKVASPPKPAPQKIAPSSGDAKAKVSPSAFSPTSGSNYVQLASIQNASAASGEWSKMQKKFTDLKSVKYRVERADLGEKGTFFRLQAGPMSSASAKDLCGRIKSKSGSCFVTR